MERGGNYLFQGSALANWHTFTHENLFLSTERSLLLAYHQVQVQIGFIASNNGFDSPRGDKSNNKYENNRPA